jgi:tripartite-type tricarboxylate transporter receptor subunit TctC
MRQGFTALAIALALAPVPAYAQGANPSGPIRLFIGSAPGDTADLSARVVAPALHTYFEQPVLLRNRTGNNGNVAAVLVARSHADGHTLLFATPALAANAGIYAGLAFHPLRDFVAVARVANVHELLVVPAARRFRTLADFIDYVHSNPARTVLASTGTASYSHLAAELFKQRAGPLNTLHVPYKGFAPAMIDLLSGEADALFATMPRVYGHVKSGRLRALAIASLKRAQALPNVPTFDESGVPGFEAVVWNAVVAPAGTPSETLVRLSLGIAHAVASAETREKLIALGAEPVADTPEQFTVYLRAEVEKWAKVAERSSIALH